MRLVSKSPARYIFSCTAARTRDTRSMPVLCLPTEWVLVATRGAAVTDSFGLIVTLGIHADYY